LEYCTGTVIGVTGSNGKSTTSAWIAHILKHAGKTAYLAGNAREGQQVLDKIETMRKDEYLVLEISDRQMIESIPKSPHIAVITNISPNHLDDHGTLDQYITVKKRLFSHQNSNDIALVNWDNELTKSFLAEIPAKKYIFTENSTLPNAQEGCFIANSELLFTTEGNTISFGKTDELLLPGKHNQANAQAAATTCFFAGISTEAIKSGLQSFAGLPHRTKLVATTETGIRFYDDIQSTTPESTIAALQMFTEKIVLIAGGDDKGMTYGALSEAIIANVEQLIILPGSGSDVLFAELESRKGSTTGYPTITSVLSFAEALLVVNALAPHPDNVVISPACAGFQSHFLENKSITSWVSEMISLT
ncbi:MAG: UDP-N-acetylmuramoyl-L-alanine--D-glutamate ligase, partial [bacterium]